MHAFDYQAPSTLEEALRLMADSNGTARPLAGGTDLIDQIRIDRLAPDLLVDIKQVTELNVLSSDASGLHVGAAVPCYRIYGDAGVNKDYTALADSCRIIGGIQIQSRASIGGNLCNSGPAADTTPSLIALEGQCVIAGPSGTRTVPAKDFCTGPGQNVLEPGELLVEVTFPPRPQHSGSHYRRFIPRNEMDIAVVGVGASVVLTDGGQQIASARIALGAVAPTPLFAEAAAASLAGKPATLESFEMAAQAAREIVAPITDMRATRDYRIHATGVLVKRVLHMAVARARGEASEHQPGH